MKKYLPLLLALFAIIPLASRAQWYVGGALGQGTTSLDGGSRSSQFLDLGFEAARTTVDETDAAARIFAGYQMHRYLALEAGYTHLGRYRQRSFLEPAGRLDSETRVGLVDLSVLGLLPVADRFTLFARGGGFSSRTRTSYEGSGSVQLTDSPNGSHRSSGFLYGVGAMAWFTPQLALRADWTRLRRVVDDGLSGREDADVWMVGVAYRF